MANEGKQPKRMEEQRAALRRWGELCLEYWGVTTIRARGLYRAQIELAAKVDDLKWAAVAKAWQDIREQGVSDDLLDGLSRLGALEDLPVLEPATDEELARVADVDLSALYQQIREAALPVLHELYPEGQPDLPPLPVLNRGAGLSWFREANEWMADKLRRYRMADLAVEQQAARVRAAEPPDEFDAAVAAYKRVVSAAVIVAQLHCKKPLTANLQGKPAEIEGFEPLSDLRSPGAGPGQEFPPREVMERLEAVEHSDIDACYCWVEEVYREAQAALEPIVADGFLRMPGMPPVAWVGEDYGHWLARSNTGLAKFNEDVLTGRVRWRKRTGGGDVSAVPAEYCYDGNAGEPPLTGAYLEERYNIPRSTARRLARRGVLGMRKVRMKTSRGKHKVNVYRWADVLAYQERRQTRKEKRRGRP